MLLHSFLRRLSLSLSLSLSRTRARIHFVRLRTMAYMYIFNFSTDGYSANTVWATEREQEDAFWDEEEEQKEEYVDKLPLDGYCEATVCNSRYVKMVSPNPPPSQRKNVVHVQTDATLPETRIKADSFSVTAQGGMLRSATTEVTGFVPAGAVCDNNSVTITICQSGATEEFPKLSSAQHLVSDVFHFLPHAMTFNRFLAMWFPLNVGSRMPHNDTQGMTIRRVKVMYSPTMLGEKPEWRELGSKEDLISAAVSSERVCLRLKHFCRFCAIEEDVAARFLFLRIFARYEGSYMKITCQFADRPLSDTDLVRFGV